MVEAGRFERPTPCAQGSFQYSAEMACFQAFCFKRMARPCCNLWSLVEPGGSRQLHFYLQRYNKDAMKLEIEVNVAVDAADKVELQEHLRKEAILALFAERKITAGKAAQELGLERLAFMDLLKQRGIPYVVYTAEDWEADAKAIDEFERRRKRSEERRVGKECRSRWS